MVTDSEEICYLIILYIYVSLSLIPDYTLTICLLNPRSV